MSNAVPVGRVEGGSTQGIGYGVGVWLSKCRTLLVNKLIENLKPQTRNISIKSIDEVSRPNYP